MLYFSLICFLVCDAYIPVPIAPHKEEVNWVSSGIAGTPNIVEMEIEYIIPIICHPIFSAEYVKQPGIILGFGIPFNVSSLALFIPKRHVQSFFDLNSKEKEAIFELLELEREKLIQQDNLITGFNIGINDGSDAGQTVMHCHVHLIPRRNGDMIDPRGGVRGVIPEKQSY